MVTSVSLPALATCFMVKNAVTSVCVVSMVTVHQLTDHATAIQDILDQPVVQVCHVQKCRILMSLFTAHQLITFIIQAIVIILQFSNMYYQPITLYQLTGNVLRKHLYIQYSLFNSVVMVTDKQ